MIKSLRKLVIKRSFLHLIKNINKNPTAKIIPYEERLKASFLVSRTKQGCLFLPLLFRTVQETSASAIRKGNKKHTD